MNCSHGALGIIDVNQHRNFNLAGRNHIDVDIGLCQCVKELACHAGIRLHTCADDRNLGDLLVAEDRLAADLLLALAEDFDGMISVFLGDSKGNILGAVAPTD